MTAHGSRAHDPRLIDTTSRLVVFLRELATVRRDQVLDVAGYPEVHWLADLPEQPTRRPDAAAGEVVLTFDSPVSEPPPDLPRAPGGLGRSEGDLRRRTRTASARGAVSHRHQGVAAGQGRHSGRRQAQGRPHDSRHMVEQAELPMDVLDIDSDLDGARNGPPLRPGRPVTGYKRAELQALLRWVARDGQRRSEDDLVAAAADVLSSTSRREQVEGLLRAALRHMLRS